MQLGYYSSTEGWMTLSFSNMDTKKQTLKWEYRRTTLVCQPILKNGVRPENIHFSTHPLYNGIVLWYNKEKGRKN